ncbi:MAG: nucleoside phosphorylase [Saprospiraceae bacterium]
MRQIPDSELVINAKGNIYHLNLHPAEIADTILTVGDPERVPQISKYFDRIEVRREHREFITHTGWLGKKRLTVVSTGIGTDNIDIVLNELDALANINFKTRTVNDIHKKLTIIRVGTSGAIWAEVQVGSMVTSAYGIGLDNLLHFYEPAHHLNEVGLLQQFKHYLVQALPVEPYVAAANAALLQQITLDYQGITLTAPGFYAPQGRELRAKTKFTTETLTHLSDFKYDQLRILNFEMETAGIYGLANLLGHRALSCNVILANRILGQFASNPAEAVERLIMRVLEQIQVID